MKNIFGVLIFTISIISYGQNLNTPKYSNEFLNIGVGARALGMSNAVITSTEDVMSGYWNPAGLTNIDQDLQIGLMHAEYFAGIAKYDFGSIAKNIDEKGLARIFAEFGWLWDIFWKHFGTNLTAKRSGNQMEIGWSFKG